MDSRQVAYNRSLGAHNRQQLAIVGVRYYSLFAFSFSACCLAASASAVIPFA
jgi:hypothetical protein